MRRYSLLFFLTMFLIGTDTFLVSPLLPTLAQLYHVSTAASGWLVSAYAIGYAGFALISGPIADHFDRKKVMLWGLCAFALATLGCGFAPNFQLMLAGRFLAGVSAAFITPQVWASIPVIVDKGQSVKVMGYATAGLSVSQLVGIPIGSYLAAFSWHTPFWVIAAAAIILLVLLYRYLPTLTFSTETKTGFWATYASIGHQSNTWPYLAAYFIFQTGSFTVITFIATWFTHSFGLTLTGVGTAMIAIGAGNLIGALFGNRLVTAIGLTKAFLIELIVLIAIYIILPMVHQFWLAECFLTLSFVLNGCLFPIFMTTLQSTATQARSTISSLSNAAMYFGETLAGIIGGWLFKTTPNYLGIAWFAALMIAIALSLYARAGLFRTKQH